MDSLFEKQLQDTLYIHSPLAADLSKTVEARALQKPVDSHESLWDGKQRDCWHFEGEGSAEFVADGILALKTLSRADRWPESEARAVDAAEGFYATFGSYIARLDVRGKNMAKGNRIRFDIRPSCPGLHSPIIRAAFVNNGTIKIPDAYSREGFNAINLENFTWNTCVWEIDSIAHDRIEEVSFQIHRYGQELSGGEELFFEIKNICFEEVECDVVHGWQCANETAVFPRSGYFTEGAKTAIAHTAASGFEILDADTGQRVFRGGIERVQTYHGSFGVLDFSPLETPGRYRIRFGDAETAELHAEFRTEFRIGDDLFEETIWRLVNFLFCERCGYPVPGKHGVCHGDVIAEHKGVRLAFQGGWHDAADVSQQTVQSAEITHALLETAEAVKSKNPLLYRRLVEEAAWGIDFVLRMRFGDGYRASNSAIRRWTDGLIGNFDDCEARTHNHSFENFIAAGVEAMAAKTFAETDRELAWKCREAAAEDFAFALDRFNETGLEAPLPQEHAGSASLSQFYAAALWSASLVHSVRPEEKLAEIASDFAEKLLCCQERDGIKTNDGAVVNGFFYRDETRKTIVHFSHQARDQLFVQALDAACSAFPAHQHRTQWEASMLLFGGYLKTISRYTAPYGMLPAGIYTLDEVDDREAFNAIHPTVSFDAERKNYIEQLESAIPLGNGAYIRCFPIWFSYRGNSAIHLSMGKAASIIGRRFADGALLQIAREQLYWTSGKNPFGQSLIYGEGSNYGQQYTALLGETVGEMPVGVQTRRNEDTPYWPQANIATYREVWTTPPGRWLWIAADLLA